MLDDLIGKKFEYGGRGPETFDCYGLCMEIYKRLGIDLPDFPTSFGNFEVDNETYNHGKNRFIRLDSPSPYCFVTLIIQPPFVSHIGIVLPDCERFINASRARDVCIEKLTSGRWSRRIEGYYKYA